MAKAQTEFSEIISNLTIEECLRKRLVDVESSALFGCESQKRELASLLKRTVEMGESNSLIIVGPRGCGKTVLLKGVLQELRSNDWSDNVAEVTLHGLLQTSDDIAIEEITRQLKLENAVGDRVFGSFAENLVFLLAALKSGDEKSKAVVFILDEFDLFCVHRNQTLLYNLFDASQTMKTPIAVIGLTCRLDVLELLEKRVKSRFSHRRLHVFAQFSFDEYLDLFRSILSLPNDGSIVAADHALAWNDNIERLSRDGSASQILRRLYDYSKDVRTLKAFLMLALARNDCGRSADGDRLPTTRDLNRAYEMYAAQNAKSSVLSDMSTVELCLVLAMKWLTDTYDGEPFNFEMVHREYVKVASRRSSLLAFDKTIVAKSFEHLVDLELAQPVDRSVGTRTTSAGASGGGGTRRHYRLVNMMLNAIDVEEALHRSKGLTTEIKQWASSFVG